MGQGRRPLLDAGGLQAVRRHCITHWHDSVIDITKWAQEYFQKPLSVNTIRRAVCRCQLKLYRAKRKPCVNMFQKHRRVLWAKAYLKWTVSKWKSVLWSDESIFEKVKVTRHTAKYGDPYSEFVLYIYPFKCTHTAVNTHTVNTHPEQWAAIYAVALGNSWGFGALSKGTSVVVLRVERALPHLQFLLARDSNSQLFHNKSNSLTIRPRLPLNFSFPVTFPFP